MRKLLLLLTFIFFSAAGQAAEVKLISAKSLKSSEGSILLKSSKQAYKIDLNGLDTSRILLTSKNKKTVSLKKWLNLAAKSGFKPSKKNFIMLTATPASFPGIGSETRRNIESLKEGKLFTPTIQGATTTRTEYICMVFWYGCSTWPA